MKSKRTNPHRRPASQADVERAERKAVVKAWAIMFTALRDKEGYDVEGLRRVWGAVESLSDGIVHGYICVDDLVDVLREEADIILE